MASSTNDIFFILFTEHIVSYMRTYHFHHTHIFPYCILHYREQRKPQPRRGLHIMCGFVILYQNKKGWVFDVYFKRDKFVGNICHRFWCLFNEIERYENDNFLEKIKKIKNKRKNTEKMHLQKRLYCLCERKLSAFNNIILNLFFLESLSLFQTSMLTTITKLSNGQSLPINISKSEVKELH